MAEEQLDYYDKIHRATWVRRVSAAMTGATMGVALGGIAGIVASFIPYTLSALGVAGVSSVALPGIAVIAQTAAIFAGAASFIGIMLNADVASNAASVAAGLEEKERRENAGNRVEKSKSFAQSTGPEKISDYYNWKVSAVTGPLFAAFGALIAATPHPAVSSAVATMTGVPGVAISGAAATAASAIIFGMFGACVGIKNAVISNKINNFYTKLITGKLFDSPTYEPQINLEQKLEQAPHAPEPTYTLPEVDFSRIRANQAVVENLLALQRS